MLIQKLLRNNKSNLKLNLLFMFEPERPLSYPLPVKPIQSIFNQFNFDYNLLSLENIFYCNLKVFFEHWLFDEVVFNRERHGTAEEKWQHLLF